MNPRQRYSPLIILFNLFNLVKSYFFVILILFVFRSDSDSKLLFYGRYVFLIIIIISIISTILKWLTSKYEIDDRSFYLYKGVFSKTEQTIPLAKIQNINRHTTFLHRILNMTSLNFETGMSNDENKVSFKVISKDEADRIETYVETFKETEREIEEIDIADERMDEFEGIEQMKELQVKNTTAARIIHFEPSIKDTLKASLTSFSFLFLIPIIISLYFKVADFFKVEDYAESFFLQMMNSWLVFSILVALFLIISFSLGILRTYLKYGKYEISSDDDRIYIKQGIVSETSFSIAKNRVQAIEMNQSFIKRLLGLTEVKLTTAGALTLNEDGPAVNTLYPFLPIKKAYQIVGEMLPTYELTMEMNRLPKKSFWKLLLKPSWTFVILTIVLSIFQPTILNSEHAWWVILVILLAIIVYSRLLAFFNTKFVLNEKFIQMKTGGFSTKLFISRREKVTEIKVSRNMIQQKLGLASITTINRGQPIHYESVDNILLSDAVHFMNWYKKKK